MKKLDKNSLLEAQGGVSELTRGFLYILGRMAATAPRMALHGAATHEILGFK